MPKATLLVIEGVWTPKRVWLAPSPVLVSHCSPGGLSYLCTPPSSPRKELVTLLGEERRYLFRDGFRLSGHSWGHGTWEQKEIVVIEDVVPTLNLESQLALGTRPRRSERLMEPWGFQCGTFCSLVSPLLMASYHSHRVLC